MSHLPAKTWRNKKTMIRKRKWLSGLFGKGVEEKRDARKSPVAAISGVETFAASGKRESDKRPALSPSAADSGKVKAAEERVSGEWHEGDVILDLYEVKGVAGEGGMGRVYRVHHRGWNMDLAVKCPRPNSFATEEQKARFMHECEVWVNLGLHPHTVSCHYVRDIGGIPCVFAEYVEGGSLKDWIDDGRLYEGGPEQAIERMLDIAIQIAWGLHYAHEQGVVHQDVKPANVMMTPDGTAKVTDFGLANARQQAGISVVGGGTGTLLVSQGGLLTPAYCSPEQARGEKLSRRTDVWSWAVSVLEMFQGEVAWQSGTLAVGALDAFLKHNGEEEDIPPMPEGVADLLRQCFQQNPDERPKTMLDCAVALGKVYESETGQAYARPEPRPADIVADGLNNRALSFLDLGKSEEAERLFDEALRVHPDHVLATYNRCLMFWHAHRMQDAGILAVLRNCEQSAKNKSQVSLCQGWMEWERGDFAAAAERFQKALTNGGGVEAQSAFEKANARIADSARCVRTFEEHAEKVTSVCLSGDGRWGLSGSLDKTLKLWDIESGQRVRTFEGHAECVTSVSLSADGRLALSGSADNTLKLWDVGSGQCLRTLKGHAERVASVRLRPDGRWALSGSWDRTLKLWDTATGHCLRTFEGHADWVTSVSLSADGRWALSGGGTKTVRLWDTATGKCLRTFEGHATEVTSVSLSADGRWALSGSGDRTLKLWDAATGHCLRTFEGHADWVTSVSLSADGRWALSGGVDKTLRLWDTATGHCLRIFEGHANSIWSLFLSTDGHSILSGSYDKTLKLWDTGKLMHRDWEGPPFVYSRVMTAHEAVNIRGRIEAAVQEGTRLLQSGHAGAALEVLREARDLPGGERDCSVLELWRQAGRRSRQKRLATAWNLRTFEGHTGGVTSVCLSGDGRWGLSGSDDKTLKLWDIGSGQCSRTFEGHTEGVASVCLSGDGRWALSGGWDDTLKLWDIRTGQCLRTFEGHAEGVTSVFLRADGRWALSGGWDDTLKLWDVRTGQCLRTFEGHAEGVTSVFLGADGRWVLSGGNDKTLKLWDTASGQSLGAFEGHTDAVASVFLGADARWALSGSWDKTLKLWDTAAGRCLQTFEGHAGIIWSVCLSRDGRWAVSGSDDRTLKLWELDWDYEAVEPADWDEGARPHLRNFLTLHTPYAAELPVGRVPSEEEITLALTRRGRPAWTEEDFQRLLETLADAGYGWLRSEGVRRELEMMAKDWNEPPPRC